MKTTFLKDVPASIHPFCVTNGVGSLWILLLPSRKTLVQFYFIYFFSSKFISPLKFNFNFSRDINIQGFFLWFYVLQCCNISFWLRRSFIIGFVATYRCVYFLEYNKTFAFPFYCDSSFGLLCCKVIVIVVVYSSCSDHTYGIGNVFVF